MQSWRSWLLLNVVIVTLSIWAAYKVPPAVWLPDNAVAEPHWRGEAADSRAAATDAPVLPDSDGRGTLSSHGPSSAHTSPSAVADEGDGAAAPLSAPFGLGGCVGDTCALELAAADRLQRLLAPHISAAIHNHSFFAHFRLNLYADCDVAKVDAAAAMCASPDCAVQVCEQSHWWDQQLTPRLQRRQSCTSLNQLNSGLPDPAQGAAAATAWANQGKLSFCVPDESRTPESELSVVDLRLNPERWTGFNGEPAHAVWDAVYNANCFATSSAALPSDFAALMMDVGAVPAPTAPALSDMCLESRVFYRLLSGMHSSISLHLCHGWPRAEGPGFAPNLAEFRRRFLEQDEGRDWLRNLYFVFAATLRSAWRAKALWQHYDFGTPTVDYEPENELSEVQAVPAGTERSSAGAAGQLEAATPVQLQRLLQALDGSGVMADSLFNTTWWFSDDVSTLHTQAALRQHFRRVGDLMNCVGCIKCRLWGKLQVRGLATALRILTAREQELVPGPQQLLLRREDVVALFNTLERFTSAISYLQNFQRLEQWDLQR